MGSVVVDTGVLIGFLDPADAHHARCVAAIRQARSAGDTIIIPTLVVAEVLVGPHRLGAGQVRITEHFLATVATRIVDLSPEIASAAASLRARSPRLRMPDAIVIATGQGESVDRIITTDASWSGIDSRIEVLRVQPDPPPSP